MDDTLNGVPLERLINDEQFNFLSHVKSQTDDDNFINDSPYQESKITTTYLDEIEFSNMYGNDKRISIMSFNVQSLPAKFNEFNVMLQAMIGNNSCPDIICLQEIWQIPYPDMYTIQGFHKPFFKMRASNTQGGGVGIYDKSEYIVKSLPTCSVFIDKVVETIFLEITAPNKKKFVVGSIYRSNSKHTNFSEKQQCEQFMETLNNIMAELDHSGLEIYISGDFNIDLLKYPSNNFASEYLEAIFSHGFLQTIVKSTRCIGNSATLIDHFLTNNLQPVYESVIIISRLSDHFPVITFCNDKTKQPGPSYHESRNFSQDNILAFNIILTSTNWAQVLQSNDTQSSYNIFIEEFLKLYNTHFPLVRTRFNRNVHKIEKWFTQGLLVARRNKIALAKLHLKTPSEENKVNYINCRNMYNRLVREAKKSYFETELAKHQSDLRMTWQLLREAMRKSKSSGVHIQSIINEGRTVSDPLVIANKFNEFFASIATLISDDIAPTDRPPDMHPATNATFNTADNPVTFTELSNIVANLKCKRSEDLNGLSMFLVKQIFTNISIPPFAHI